MTRPQAKALGERSLVALRLAGKYLEDDSDSAASKAYYAAFYAVSAWFALQGRSFRRHSALRKAINEELVHTGKWPVELGKAYSFLFGLRSTADYGREIHVTRDEAEKAINLADKIISKVRESEPDIFKE